MVSQQYGKVLNHPDVEQIISKLVNGETTRAVAAWIKTRHKPKDKQLSPTLLDNFRREYLNIKGNFINDIRQLRNEQIREEASEDLKETIKKNKTYSEKMEEFVDTQVDLKKKMYQILNLVETRAAQLFDSTQSNVSNLKPDRYLLEYFGKILDIAREIKKLDGAPDQIIQHNVAIQHNDKQIFMFQEAIIQSIQELPLDIASMVMDKINSKLSTLSPQNEEPKLAYSNNDIAKVEKLANSTKLLEASIIETDEYYGNEEEEFSTININKKG